MSAVLDKRLVFVTGKGGVGKSTVAAALGTAAAARGRRALVCEVAGVERMPGALGHAGVGYRETELKPNLWAISIDPERALEEYLRDQIGSSTLYNVLFENRIVSYLAAATPGLRELLTIGKIWELAQLERRSPADTPYDVVIVDAPATGHGLGLLRTPRTFRDVARVGPIRRQADLIHSFVTDPRRTGVVCVALPEEMPVNETLELRRSLAAEMGMELDAVVVNALYPERFSAAEAERIETAPSESASPAVHAALTAALAEHRRAQTQRTQLRRLRREAGDSLPSVTLPFLFERDLGLEAWARLGHELERSL